MGTNKYQLFRDSRCHWNLPLSLALLASISLTFFLLPTSLYAVSSSEFQALKQRVDQLYTTNEKNYRDVARAMNQLSTIQRDFQAVKGHMDASNVLKKESDRVYQDLDTRVSSLEDKIDQLHSLLKEIRGAGGASDGAPAAKQSAEYEEYQALLDIFNARDYRSAASGFLGYLNKYPQSSYAGNARFWVGESFYSLSDYERSISEFQKFQQKNPEHSRVKESVLKQGLAFMKLNKYPEAKLFFQKVMADYPGSSESAKAEANLLRLANLEQGQAPAEPQSGDPSSTTAPKTPKDSETKENSTQKKEIIYRPIMKPNPMPGAERPNSDSSSTPLF